MRPSDPERKVVGGETLEIAQDRARRARRSERRRSPPSARGRRPFRRARNQIARRGHQTDAADHVARSEEDRHNDPAGACREREQPAQRAGHTATPSRRASRDRRRARRGGRRVAPAPGDERSRAPSGRREPLDRLGDDLGVHRIQSAVGSSRITSGASRRNARARAMRRALAGGRGRPPSPTTVSYPSGSARRSRRRRRGQPPAAPARPRPRDLRAGCCPRCVRESASAVAAPRPAAPAKRRCLHRRGRRRRRSRGPPSARRGAAERGDRALARSARADEGHGLARRELEVEPSSTVPAGG